MFGESTSRKAQFSAQDWVYSGASWRATADQTLKLSLNSTTNMAATTHAIVGQRVNITCNILHGGPTGADTDTDTASPTTFLF